MAVGPATSASISDLRTLVQPQDPDSLPVSDRGDGAEGENGVAASGPEVSSLDTAATGPAAPATDTANSRGENENPGAAAAQARDDRLPNSGDPNRGTTLDIAV